MHYIELFLVKIDFVYVKKWHFSNRNKSKYHNKIDNRGIRV